MARPAPGVPRGGREGRGARRYYVAGMKTLSYEPKSSGQNLLLVTSCTDRPEERFANSVTLPALGGETQTASLFKPPDAAPGRSSRFRSGMLCVPKLSDLAGS